REAEGDRADPRIQVEDALPALERGELARHAVQQLGHLGVRLEERLRGDAQVELAEALGELRLAPHELGLAPGRRLREAARARPQHAAETLAQRGAQMAGELTGVELALGRDDPDLQPIRAPAF